MGTRITVDLGNPALLKLLKMESQETNSTVREVLIRALESYFAHKLETKALMRASEAIFEEWNDPKDSDYDKL
jgi:hypothetical protein